VLEAAARCLLQLIRLDRPRGVERSPWNLELRARCAASLRADPHPNPDSTGAAAAAAAARYGTRRLLRCLEAQSQPKHPKSPRPRVDRRRASPPAQPPPVSEEEEDGAEATLMFHDGRVLVSSI